MGKEPLPGFAKVRIPWLHFYAYVRRAVKVMRWGGFVSGFKEIFLFFSILKFFTHQ